MRGVKPLDFVETAREGILVLDPDLTVRFANRSFCQTFAVAPEDTVGRKLHEIGDGQWDIPKLHTALDTIISGRNGNTIEAFESEYLSSRSGGASWCLTRARSISRATRYNRSCWRSKTVCIASFANMPAGSGVDYLWSVARKF